MAKPKPKAKGKAAAPAKGGSNKLLFLVTGMALVPFSLPTLLVLFVGMLPTLGAAIAERGGGRYAWLCVGGLNFAGLAPWLFALWFGHHTIDYALEEIKSITMLLVAYGASGVAWVLYLAMPPVIGTFTAMNSQRRSVGLVATQKKLVEQWGDGVITRDE